MQLRQIDARLLRVKLLCKRSDLDNARRVLKDAKEMIRKSHYCRRKAWVSELSAMLSESGPATDADPFDVECQ